MDNNDSNPQLSWMGSRLRAGKITRRDFIGTATSIGLGMAISASLADQALASASPRKGGTLKVAMGHGESGDILDPASLFNGYQWALNYAFRNTLTQIGPGNVVEPGLAISWEAIPGAKQWTFELRQGVEFSNGKSMTTEDVIASSPW